MQACLTFTHCTDDYCWLTQGVVAFFPAFSHCEQLYARWQQTGMLGQIAAKKQIFKEPRAASEVEAMLQQYAACIAQTDNASSPACTAAKVAGKACSAAVTGALMLCVVGGKLSEGINFSDGFGRSACKPYDGRDIVNVVQPVYAPCAPACMHVFVQC